MQMGVDTPISVVHDVSRESELGRWDTGFGGYANWELSQAAATGAVERQAWDPFGMIVSNALRFRETYLEQFWIFYIGHVVIRNSSVGQVFDHCSICLQENISSEPMPYHPNQFAIPLGYYDDATESLQLSEYGGALSMYQLWSDQRVGVHRPFWDPPLFVPYGSRITIELEAGAISSVDLDVILRFWIGPKGVYVPGMK
jgi:hypothetical protein